MNQKVKELYITRIGRFLDRLPRYIYKQTIPFEMEYRWCKDAVPYAERLDGEYKSIKEGGRWGEFWESAWFHLTGTVPAEWKGEKIVARLDFSGEGLVFQPDGKIVQGITNGSVFDQEFARDNVHLIEKCEGGEEVELWVETAANGLFGMFTEPDPAEDSPRRYGWYEAEVKQAKLCVFDAEMWHLWLDVFILKGLIDTLPENSVRRARIIRCVNDGIDAFQDDPQNSTITRKILKRELEKPAAPSDLTVTAAGHAHIDTAWLWPVRETVRKCARTFSSQLALIEKYPDYVFGASQPQHYQFVKDNYPELYQRVKQAVEEGRWEPQGGMWVEADCNVPSGESLIRQILYGKNFFRDEFGVEVDNVWLPDVFGYSANLPQIMARSGIKYFLTQKISWSQFSEFPHHTFLWQGIDGSEVLTHFPPENTYNSQLSTKYLVPGRDNFKEKDFIDEFISLFGVGDGGGGPKEENLEYGLRMQDLEGSPRVKFGKACDFFARLEGYRGKLAQVTGELYVENHRGTLTTQARLKKLNRRLENMLNWTEKINACLPVEDYPAEQIDWAWKKLLLNQFHDIIPGSSITEVYKTSEQELSDGLQVCHAVFTGAAERLLEHDHDSLVVFNLSAYRYREVIFPFDDEVTHLCPEHAKAVFGGIEDLDRVFIEGDIAPFSMQTVRKEDLKFAESSAEVNLVLENELIRYEFGEDGTLVSAFDKEVQREIIPAGKRGNVIALYEDLPLDFDAWNVDVFYENCLLETAKVQKLESFACKGVMEGIKMTMTIGSSQMNQTVILKSWSKRLDFKTTVEWQETHKMLRVSFPADVQTDHAVCDIQYGFVRRANHRNTVHDLARFEVTGHKYADLSDSGYGAALLNDCKYGYKVLGDTLDLNLLRSPNYPDPDADRGTQSFTYSFLPHKGNLAESEVIPEAVSLNVPQVLLHGYMGTDRVLPLSVESDSVTLEVVKKAEKEDCLIVRLVETRGNNSSTVLKTLFPYKLIETNLMETEEYNSADLKAPLKISFKPFEIRTFKLGLRDI